MEKLCASQIYDVLGHPFNIRLFKNLPDFDVTPYLIRVAKAIQKANMAVDVNTGTYYRYPIAEISPYPDFMKIAHDYNLPIITSSDAHQPEHCGNYIDEAIAYAKSFGYTTCLQFVGFIIPYLLTIKNRYMKKYVHVPVFLLNFLMFLQQKLF